MQKNKLNNIIVLKDMASNFVEEAIVVLKPNIELKREEKDYKSKLENGENKNKSIIKEAEFIIENSLKNMKEKENENAKKDLEKRYKKLKKIVYALLVINVLLLIKIF